MKSWVTSHKFLAAGLGVAIVLVAVLLLWVEVSRAPAPSSGDTTPIGMETTIEGEIVCLPHKDTDGPQTLECAYGIKLANGTYYGLHDSNDNYENISGLPTGKNARLTGTLKLGSSDRYQSIGTFTVVAAETLE